MHEAMTRAGTRVEKLAGRVRHAYDEAATTVWGTCRDAGTTTAEYAMVTMAAVGFAGLLALVLRSDEVRGMLTDLVHRALNQ